MPKMSLSTAPSNQTRLKTQRNLMFGAITVAALVLLVFLQINSAVHNIDKIDIKPGESVNYDNHLINEPSGEIIQQGHAVFTGNIYNKGTFDCGKCNTGITQFMSESKRPQVIRGTNPLTLYKIEIFTPSNLTLDAELKVVNSVKFHKGDIITDTRYDEHCLHFLEGATVINAGDESHVKGFVAKTGSEEFIFPIGDGNKLRKVGISGTDKTTSFKAAFIPFTQKQLTTKTNHSISPSSLSKELLSIATKGCWQIKGNHPVKLYFYWDPSFELENQLESIGNLMLVGWIGKSWELVSVESISGDLASGSITTFPMIPENYEAYAYAILREDVN